MTGNQKCSLSCPGQGNLVNKQCNCNLSHQLNFGIDFSVMCLMLNLLYKRQVFNYYFASLESNVQRWLGRKKVGFQAHEHRRSRAIRNCFLNYVFSLNWFLMWA